VRTPPSTTIGPVLRLAIELGDTDARKTRDKMPSVRYCIVDGDVETASGLIRMDEEEPRIDAADNSVALVIAETVLSRVLDELTWLVELKRILRPGGEIHATVPAAGALAWLDAHNLYRYLTDITGRGASPTATLPTGWNRHYYEDEIEDLVEDAGLTVASIERTGVGLAEVPHLAGLVVGDYVLQHPRIEKALHPRRQTLDRADRAVRVPGLGKILTVIAKKP
jgi:hypothetical protein